MNRPIYLDYAATTPIDEAVLEKMLPFMSREGQFGNSGSSSHVYGWEAQEAVEEAQFLTKFAGTVHWITVKDPVGVPFADDLLACDNVKHWNSSRLVSIDGDDSGVTGIRLKQRGAESEESLDVTGVFVYVAGQLPITDFCQASGLEFNEEGNHESGIKVNDEMATNQPGVYAIGDIRNTPYKQVVVAAADGCIAAMAIDKYLKGRKNVKVDWVHN